MIPRKIKITALKCLDPVEYSPFRISSLSDDQVDCLVYMASGIKPTTRISDLACKTKGELRDAIFQEAGRLKRTQPERQLGLASDFNNVVAEAIRLGLEGSGLDSGSGLEAVQG